MDAIKLFNNMKKIKEEASAENNGGMSKDLRAKLMTYANLHKGSGERVGSRTTIKIVPLTYKDSISGEEKPYSSIDGYYSLKFLNEENKTLYSRIPTRKAVQDYSNSVNKDVMDSLDLDLLEKVNNVLYDIADYYTNFNLKADVAKNVSAEFLSKYKQLGGIQYIPKSLAIPCFYISKSYQNGAANGQLNYNHFTFLFIEKSLMYEEFLSSIETYCYSKNSEHPELVFSELFSGNKVFEITIDKKDSNGTEVGKVREDMFNKPDSIVEFKVSDVTPEISNMINSEEVSNYRKIDPLNDNNFFGLKRLDRKVLDKLYSQSLQLESYLVISDCFYSSKRQDELEPYLPKANADSNQVVRKPVDLAPQNNVTVDPVSNSQQPVASNDGTLVEADDDESVPF